MFYTVRHTTTFRYSAPITESYMEARLQPRSEGGQHCLDFRLSVSPAAQIFSYRGEHGNWVHHFDVPNRHTRLTITAEANVEVATPPELPEALDPDAWDELDAATADDTYWDTLHASRFARPSELLDDLAAEYHIQRQGDPLTTVRSIAAAVHDAIAYAKDTTRVDSPIDDALQQRQGVCQDFAHIMIALTRPLGIPARYVSGYLFHQQGRDDLATSGATHAWVETYLLGLGWVGFDPTNNMSANERHIRVAIGRDYADVPPTRGVFRGSATSELAVNVLVYPTDSPAPQTDTLPETVWAPATQDHSDQPTGLLHQRHHGSEQQQQQQ